MYGHENKGILSGGGFFHPDDLVSNTTKLKII